jgi:Na+/H+-dicarboxylate symporter/ABC-type amino acid transport substrate-binding protein
MFGILASWLVPEYTHYWKAAGDIFIRSSQLVTMPFIMLELACSLGGLSNASLRTLLRTGGLVFVLLVMVGGLAVILVPTWLPPLTSSNFYTPTLLAEQSQTSLIERFIPFNIFAAMAEDNFPAIVMFSGFVGLVLQGLSNNEILLAPMNSARELFRRLNKIVLKMTPIAVFSLVSTTLAAADTDELLRLHALPVIGLSGLLLLSVAVIGLTMSVSTLTWKEFWNITKAPLILTASTSNLIISLPTLVSSLQEVLSEKYKDRGPEMIETCNEQIGAAVPVGFALPTLGQVYMLMMIPFMGWYADRPFGLLQKLNMLATGIPGSIGGIQSVVRQELAAASLPESLLSVFFLNREWVFRTEKILSLLGLIVLVLCIVGVTTGTIRLRKRRFIGALAASILLGTSLTYGVYGLLSKTLAGTYKKDQVLLDRAPLISVTTPIASISRVSTIDEASETAFPSLPVKLDSMRARGILRIGIKTSDVPWSFHGANGKLLGYDADVIQAIANFSSLKVHVVEAPLEVLEHMINNSQLDLALGGIEENAYRAARVHTSNGYQTVHRALVAWHQNVLTVQSAELSRINRPLRIAVADPYMPSADLKDAIEEFLGNPGPAVPVSFARIANVKDFFVKGPTDRYDALLWNAEGGSSWSVLHPQTDVLTVFGSELPNQIVMLLGGTDSEWQNYVNEWIGIQTSERLFEKLYRHWILVTE